MLFKVFQMVTLVAVANPFCCCASEYLDKVFSSESKTLHACCGTMPSDTGNMPESGSGHPDKCPHQETKAHQQATQQDIAAPHMDPLYAPLLIALLDRSDVIPQEESRHPLFVELTASAVRPPGFQEVYCVYRI